MKTELLLALASVVVAVPGAFAAPDSAGVSVLTLRQAVDRALGANPSVVEAREKVQEQKSFHSAGISALFPRLNGTLRGERRKDSVLTGLAAFNGEAYNQYEASLQLVQPIYNGGGLWSGLTSLSRARTVADLDLKIAERDTTVDVIAAYYTVLMNQEKLAALRNNRKIQDESLGVAKHRANIGRGQTLDVLEMKTQIALLDSKIAQTEADLKTAVVGLMLLFADRTTTAVDLKGSLRPKGLREFLAKTKDRPYEIYEFSRIAAVRDQTEATNKTSLAKYWPQLNFVGNYGRVSNTRADLTNDFANAWSYGLELTIPIFSGLSSVAEGNAYASQLKQIEIQEARVKDAAAFAETKAMHDLQAAEGTIQTSADALDLANQAMKEAARNYRYSTIDYLRYLSIQQSLLDTQVAYQTAELTYITSIAHYLVATGHDVGELVGVLEGTP
ncbi:MAG: TolC family protein [Bdellovibrionales bacterium]|nr:TolC family protein [Bdellovibrionales bacterium]